jgi:AraC family ethanolamine operon transcriptional activator
VVERAEAYIRAHYGTSVAVAQLCRIAGVSERALRRAFRRILGSSPKQYMLVQRLQAVRRALTEKSGAPITVTEAAIGCGFFELGRFAAAYRKVYGEAPSDTLRARRRQDRPAPRVF